MSKHIQYRTRGTCSRSIELELDDNNVIESVSFLGGCSGNTQGVAALVQGMKAEDAVRKLEGIRCGFRDTSCPDQLALALKSAMSDN